ncbi:MAG: site-specific DNA-methyltransferase [Bacteroidota bacterium]
MKTYRLTKGKIFHGDALEVLKSLPDKCIQCCVTSPPYWGLRDYGVKGQLGLESTPEEYVEKLTAVFREVRRVLKDDGTLWLNLGDSYSGSGQAWRQKPDILSSLQQTNKGSLHCRQSGKPPVNQKVQGLKPKELVGIPWRVAFALQADGWYLRSDIIWHKSNAMPEPVTDRPTKSHEYIFLFSKSRKYFYDADAIREPHKEITLKRMRYGWDGNQKQTPRKQSTTVRNTSRMCHPKGANKRTVWTIAKGAFRGNHFATFPSEIPKTCIKAGSKICDMVLDPFAGSGTTLIASHKLERSFLGIELNKRYITRLFIPALRKSYS